MSDCTNGGRNVYEPTCTIKIKFEGQERLWVYPLALNGRTIESVEVGGVEYEPKASKGSCKVFYDASDHGDVWTCGECKESWIQDTDWPKVCPYCERTVKQ